MRIAIGIEYIGTQYHGWQLQEPGKNIPTIQQHLDESLSKIADSPILTTSAGRTDKGVHATGQVAHFDTEVERPLHSWVQGTNRYLPDDIAITWAKIVSDEFHARFSATARRYEYYIINRPTRSPQWHQRATWHYHPLDIEAMQVAAQHLIGEHDFNAYRASECQAKTSVREVIHLNINKQQDMIKLDIKANSFLHHMVRNIVGVLLAIGEGKESPDWSKELLESKDRSLGGVTAKPEGLYLAEVSYLDLITPHPASDVVFGRPLPQGER